MANMVTFQVTKDERIQLSKEATYKSHLGLTEHSREMKPEVITPLLSQRKRQNTFALPLNLYKNSKNRQIQKDA